MIFGNLFNMRLKSAEAALADGRLEEALRLATSPDLLGEKRTQAVLAQLGEKFFERAEEQFKVVRYAEALSELDKAARAGVQANRVSDLRTIIQAAAEDYARREDVRRQHVEEVQDHLARGSLRSAEQILHHALGDTPEGQQLLHQAQHRRQRVEELLSQVKQHVAEGYWSAAVARFKDVVRQNPKEPQAAVWEKKLLESILQSVHAAISEGRVLRAVEEMQLLQGVGEQDPAKKSEQELLNRILSAGQALESGQYGQARRILLGVKQGFPQAPWIEPLCQQLQNLDDQLSEIYSSPLGLLSHRPLVPLAIGFEERVARAGLDETVATPYFRPAGSMLPEQLWLLVDGVGSYLVVRRHRVSIGRSASSQPADIPLASDLSERHADLTRMEDDYFLSASREINVNGQNLRQKLLQSGDKIILGKRAKMTFHLPSRKSSTAVLALSDSTKMAHDVRQVILLDQLLTIGRSSNSHIVANHAAEELILFEREGRLWVRSQHQGRNERGIPLEIGQHVELGGVGFVIEHWKSKVG